MSNFAIIADPSSGLNKELREKYGIDDYIKGHITFPDGTDHDVDLDWSDSAADEYFYSMAKKKAIYKTGAPNPNDIQNVMRKYLEQGRDILIVTLSSGMSGTYAICCKTAKDLEGEFPDRKVAIVDSLRFSAPMILMNIQASRMRDEGKSLEEVEKWIVEHRNCYRQAGGMNDLKFLARTGRISSGKAFFGQLAGINSLGDFMPNGVSNAMVNVKGIDKTIAANIEYMKATGIDIKDQTIIISNSYRKAEAEKLKAAIEKEFAPKEILMVRVDMLCGANIGPGMFAAYYLGKEATADMAWEKETYEAIVAKLK